MSNDKNNNEYQRLRNLVRKTGFELRRQRTKLAREWNCGYYIINPENNTIEAGGYHNLGLCPGEVEEFCSQED
jgi:hypothetical protein